MDLITAAITNSAGPELASTRNSFFERTKDENISFAESFDERISIDTDSAPVNAVPQTPVELLEANNGVPLEVLDDANVAPALVRTVKVHVESFSEVDGETSSLAKNPNTGVAAGSFLSTAMFRKVLTESGDILEVSGSNKNDMTKASSVAFYEKADSANASMVQGGLSSSTPEEVVADLSNIQERVLSPNDTSITLSPMVNSAVTGKSALHSIAEREDQREVAETGASELETFMKKMSKGHDTAAKKMVALKSRNEVDNTTAFATKPAEGIAVAAPALPPTPTPVLVPIAVTTVGDQQHVADKGSQGGLDKAILMERRSVDMATGAMEGKTDKADAHGRKAAMTDGQPLALASGDTAISNSELAKPMLAALPGGSDSNRKVQSNELAVTSVHAVVGTNGSVPGAISIQAAGGGIVSKFQSGDVGTHTASMYAESGEQGGPDIETSSAFDGSHKMLLMTPTALEVGIPNGTQGWLKIRAEMADGGVVNASLSAASTAGQDMLHRELPTLTAYLQQERVAVNTVVIQATASAEPESRGLAGGMSSGGQAQQRNHQGAADRQAVNDVVTKFTDEVAYEGTNKIGADELLSSVSYAGGSWLSIRA